MTEFFLDITHQERASSNNAINAKNRIRFGCYSVLIKGLTPISISEVSLARSFENISFEVANFIKITSYVV